MTVIHLLEFRTLYRGLQLRSRITYYQMCYLLEANCTWGSLYYCAFIFCVFLTTCVFSFNLGACWVFQKYRQSIKNHNPFKMYQYHDTI